MIGNLDNFFKYTSFTVLSGALNGIVYGRAFDL